MGKRKRQSPGSSPTMIVGRYAVCGEIASGGMATVHLGRLLGPVGFSRTVAIKKLHPQLAKDPEFTAMFLDEARLAARIRHPNVVPTLDVVAQSGELLLVMEYVHGESLAFLQRAVQNKGGRIPPRIAANIVAGVLQGLHAAHDATNERGEPLGIVHRDVSPQNVLVGTDGIARIFDFGVAKAIGRLHTTREGAVKGKLAYMAPEQIRGVPLTRRTDVFAASVVLWGALAGRRLFTADNEGELLFEVLERPIEPPSHVAPGLSTALDEVVMRGLQRDPARRFATAREMASALEKAAGVASAGEVAEWVEEVASERLRGKARALSLVESTPDGSLPAATAPIEIDAPTTDTTGVSSPNETTVARTSATVRRTRLLTLVAIALAMGVAAGALWGSTRTGPPLQTATAGLLPLLPEVAPPPVPAAEVEPGSSAEPRAAPSARPRVATPAKPVRTKRPLYARE